MMRRKLVVGNWKLHGSKESISNLVQGIIEGSLGLDNIDIGVSPTFVHLGWVYKLIEGSQIKLSAQNVCEQNEGAFTGEVSAPMLAEIGCKYIIVGHSERRHIYGEKDSRVAEKFAACSKAGVTPILCVGELLEERESGDTEVVIAQQLDAVIDLLGIAGLENAVIAYEPVWAIGTGKTATPEQAQEVHAYIRNRITEHNSDLAQKIRILYGGSVKANNAAALFEQADVDGGLIGGASLKAEEFLSICKAANI